MYNKETIYFLQWLVKESGFTENQIRKYYYQIVHEHRIAPGKFYLFNQIRLF